MERVLTLNEVGEMIRVPTATLRYWPQRGTALRASRWVRVGSCTGA